MASDMAKRPGAGFIAINLGVGLLALIAISASPPGRAQSADLVLCDRIAADPSDPGYGGTRRIARDWVRRN
jgi:hypothetical protein